MIVNARGPGPGRRTTGRYRALPMRSSSATSLFSKASISWNPTGLRLERREEFLLSPESGEYCSVSAMRTLDGAFEPTVTPEIATDLADLIFDELPGFEASVQRRVWSCFRTKTPEGRFHIGRSQQSKDFFWSPLGRPWRRVQLEIAGWQQNGSSVEDSALWNLPTASAGNQNGLPKASFPSARTAFPRNGQPSQSGLFLQWTCSAPRPGRETGVHLDLTPGVLHRRLSRRRSWRCSAGNQFGPEISWRTHCR